jgi:Ca2+-binding RTX toxin-like protein
VISGTPGDDTIVANLHGETINTGAGNDSVFAGGTGDTINAGGGNDTIQAFAGGNTIITGAGNDTIRIAGSGNVVNAGGGANTIDDSGSGNTLVLPSAGQGSHDIFGYVLNAHDLFDLRAALSSAGWNGNQASLSDYLSVGTANNGADTTVMVAPNGTGTGAVLATLHGNGAIGLPAFLTHAIVS